MLPDTGERYMTTPLFADIPEEMTRRGAGHFALHARLSFRCSRRRRTATAGRTRATPEARAELAAAIGDATQPVVMFALEWCEFCWSARKLFDRIRDSPIAPSTWIRSEYQQGNRGGKLRAALRERTGWVTLPQIFIGGEFVGGSHRPVRRVPQRQAAATPAVAGHCSEEEIANPYGFLPKWLHPRAQ